jgi:ubiquinone/menaquinone biosynthesis C-methylase UbiE
MKNYSVVLKYFKNKAKTYDLVDNQIYWKFSDDLLWYLLEKFALKNLKNSNFHFMDAGGGTGRWSIKILENYPRSTGIIYDISLHMLAEANKKINTKNLSKRIITINGNIEKMKDQDNNTYDLIINFHNVLGFVNNPRNALKEMFRLLKKGGYLVSVIPNKYHGIFFNISEGRIGDAEKLTKNNIGTFHKSMPEINFFTPENIRKIYKDIGMKEVKVYGFPITLYPTYKENTVKSSTIKIRKMLQSKKDLINLEDIEKSIILNEEASARGNNLFTIGKKT